MTIHNRRRFFGRMGMAAAGMAAAGCATGRPDAGPVGVSTGRQPFKVRLESPRDPGIRRAFDVLRDRLETRNALEVTGLPLLFSNASRKACRVLLRLLNAPATRFLFKNGSMHTKPAMGPKVQDLVFT